MSKRSREKEEVGGAGRREIRRKLEIVRGEREIKSRKE